VFRTRESVVMATDIHAGCLARLEGCERVANPAGSAAGCVRDDSGARYPLTPFQTGIRDREIFMTTDPLADC